MTQPDREPDSRQDLGSSGTSVYRRIDHVPRLSPYLVTRPRLMAALETPSPLTLLRAPVGFGKTTLVAQWAAEQDREAVTVAWLRVRREAGAATAFWTEALEVLADAGLPVPSRASWPAEAHRLAGIAERAMLEAESPVLLVIDGFDNVSDIDVDLTLLDIVRHTPQLRLIVCVRGHQHFPAQHHLDVDATVLTARDLRFTIEESRELLALVGVELPESSEWELYAESAGWPEPTRAFALHLRDAPTTDPDDLAAIVNRIATDYLRRRLLPETQRPGRMELALLTSVPEDFSVEVAELLTEDPDAKSHLDALVADGVLSAEIRGAEVVYCWPPAARRALDVELRRRWPERLAELHTRLGRWYLDDQQAGRALRHAVQARDWRLVVEVIDSSWRMLAFENADDLYDAFVAMPIEEVATSERALALRDTRLHVPDDRLLAVAKLPEPSDELTALGRSDEAADILDTGYAVLLALRTRGSFDRARTYGARLLEIAAAARAAHPSDVVGLYPSVQLHVGITHMLGGDLASAQQALLEAHTHSTDDPLGYVESDAAGKLALTCALVGDVRQATTWIERHETAPLAASWMVPRIRITATAARLLVALDRLDLEGAAGAADDVSTHMEQEEFWAHLVFAQALHALHVGTASDMLDRIARSRTGHRDWLSNGAAAGPLLASVEGALLLALGRGNLARAVLQGPHGRHPLLRAGQARLALLAGRDDDALRLSSDTGWDAAAIPRHRLEMLVIRTIAAHRVGDPPVAVDALRRAVDIARATGALRAFTTVPRAELADLSSDVPAARDLLTEEPLASSPELFPPHVTLIELTAREQQVLEGLADGLTTQQIADRAVVSYNTVRTQQRSLYKKLGTSDRADALARARQWGLLPTEH